MCCFLTSPVWRMLDRKTLQDLPVLPGWDHACRIVQQILLGWSAAGPSSGPPWWDSGPAPVERALDGVLWVHPALDHGLV